MLSELSINGSRCGSAKARQPALPGNRSTVQALAGSSGQPSATTAPGPLLPPSVPSLPLRNVESASRRRAGSSLRSTSSLAAAKAPAQAEWCIPSSLLGQFESMPHDMVERIEARHKLQSAADVARQLHEQRREQRLAEAMAVAKRKAEAAELASQRQIGAMVTRGAKRR